MSINSAMTNLANQVRMLCSGSGTGEKLSIAEMGSNLGSAVNECDTQADLIEQIKTALQGKVVEQGTIVETADATATEDDILEGATAYVSGRKITGKHICESVGVEIMTTTTKPSSNSTSIAFTGLTAQPVMFAICPTGNITLGSTRYVTSVMYDGSTTHGTYGYRSSSSGTSYYSSSYFTWTYSNGTLTVRTSSSTNGGNFSSSVTYRLVYVVY